MKYRSLLRRSALPAALASALSGVTPVLTEPPVDNPNHFSLSYRMAFGVGVNFKHVGQFTPPGLLRQTPAGDPFNYDDGYVLTDSSGNLMGFTRYWGYDSPSQLPGNGTIVFDRSSSSGGSTGNIGDGDPQPGFELNYDRELGQIGKMHWGVELAFNYMNVCEENSGPQEVGVNQTTDVYPLPTLPGGGYVVPAPAPHYQGPTALHAGDTVIGATPTSSSTQTIAAIAMGSRQFNADIYGMRLGPYLDLPLTHSLDASLSAGLALAEVDSQFNYSETISVAGVPQSSGSSSHNGLLCGGYVSGTLSYALNKNWDVVGGVQFQDLGKYTQTVNGRQAVLDLSKSTFVTAGVSFSF